MMEPLTELAIGLATGKPITKFINVVSKGTGVLYEPTKIKQEYQDKIFFKELKRQQNID